MQQESLCDTSGPFPYQPYQGKTTCCKRTNLEQMFFRIVKKRLYIEVKIHSGAVFSGVIIFDYVYRDRCIRGCLPYILVIKYV